MASSALPATCSLPQPRIEGQHLVLASFQLLVGRRSYLNRDGLRIDLSLVEPDLYRLHAVQDFWIEDHNPDLTENRAAVFLGRPRADQSWEVPESWPIECRSLAILGTVDTRGDPYRFVCHEG